MTATRHRFSLAVHIYLWGFFALLCLSPIGILIELDDRLPIPVAWWAISVAWPLLVAFLSGYALRRCSGPQMHFKDGLLWITRSMMTGWTTISFVVVPPCLLAAFVGSVAIAGLGDIRRQPDYAAARWAHLVSFFYRQRMRQ